MLDEMKEKFEDSFTDEEKIQIFNLIFSGYYSLSYIKFLAQKKAGRDLGIEVTEPQNLLPPEGEGADYDDYLDAILKQPNKEAVLENPNKPEKESKEKEDVRIEMPSVDTDSTEEKEEESEIEKSDEEDNSISDSPINSSPLEESSLSGELEGEVGPDSSIDSEEEEKTEIPEGFAPTKVDEDDTLNVSDSSDAEEEKEPLTPNLPTEEKEESEQSSEEEDKKDDVITFGFGDSNAGEAHEPTIEVIQEDTRPKKEEAAPEIKIVAPTEGEVAGDSNTQATETVELPTATPESPASTIPMPDATTNTVTQPSQEVPTISLADLTNPQPTQVQPQTQQTTGVNQ